MSFPILDAVSLPHLQDHLRTIAQWSRFSGSEGEARAFDYIEDQLRALGFQVARFESDALIGTPGVSSVTVLDSDGDDALEAFGYSLGPATSADGVVGRLVYVGDASPQSWTDLGVSGKIILSDGIATPEKARWADEAGALGQVCINPDHFYEMCISPVWGSPDQDNTWMLPSVPAVGVTHGAGNRLKHALGSGPGDVRLITLGSKDWVKIPTLTGEIRGRAEDSYVLLSGHVDSWHLGAMDNATANATQLEVARLLSQHRNKLRRGVRVSFWSGHSHGRYAGSAWYGDEFWHDLHDRCVCHVNVDSLGGRGASVLEHVPAMAETYALACEVIETVAGVKPEFTRISRSSDQSFWGHGVPSLFGTLSEQRPNGADTDMAVHRGIGFGWWWHTPEDTLDKIDPANLHRDAKIYALALWRLCTDERLPLDYAAGASDMADTLADYHARGDGAVDLRRVEELARRLSTELRSLNVEAGSAAEVNELLVGLARLLVPVVYTRSGSFRQDPALPTPALPGLSRALDLPSLGLDSPARHELVVTLTRERNRVEHALRAALRMVDAHRRVAPSAGIHPR